MNKLTKFVLIVGVLATLSGCAYGTYNTYGGSSPSPGEPNYLTNCGPMNDQQGWPYGGITAIATGSAKPKLRLSPVSNCF